MEINPELIFIKQSPLWRRWCSSASQEVPYLALNLEDSQPQKLFLGSAW
jgi:hypothetical protein